MGPKINEAAVGLTKDTEADSLAEVASNVGGHTQVHAAVCHTHLCDLHGA